MIVIILIIIIIYIHTILSLDDFLLLFYDDTSLFCKEE